MGGSVTMAVSGHVLLRLEVLWYGAEVLFTRFAAYQSQHVSYAIIYRRLLEEGLPACFARF